MLRKIAGMLRQALRPGEKYEGPIKLRVLILDGFDWEWFCNDIQNLPNMRRMLDLGCGARLEVCMPPLTSSAVATMLTGREPKEGWMVGDQYSTSQNLIRQRPWIHELEKYGMSIGLCNMPLTWPVFPLPRQSWMTSGFPVPPVAISQESWVHPKSLDVSKYPIEGVIRDTGVGGTKAIDKLQQVENKIVDWFLEAPKATVQFIWVRQTDSAGHHFFGSEKYLQACREADRVLGRIFKDKDTENLLVLSDHGFDYLTSARCKPYMATSHGPTSLAAGVVGGHTMHGILFASGPDIKARGVLPDQKLIDVAGGIFDILQIPPPEGMHVGSPLWAAAAPATSPEGADISKKMKDLGYE